MRLTKLFVGTGESNSNVATYTAPSAQENFFKEAGLLSIGAHTFLVSVRSSSNHNVSQATEDSHIYIQRTLFGSAGKPKQMPLNLIGFATRLSLCLSALPPVCWRTTIRTWATCSKDKCDYRYTIRQSILTITGNLVSKDLYFLAESVGFEPTRRFTDLTR